MITINKTGSFIVGAILCLGTVFAVEAFSKPKIVDSRTISVTASIDDWNSWLNTLKVASTAVGRNIPSYEAFATVDSINVISYKLYSQLKPQFDSLNKADSAQKAAAKAKK